MEIHFNNVVLPKTLKASYNFPQATSGDQFIRKLDSSKQSSPQQELDT